MEVSCGSRKSMGRKSRDDVGGRIGLTWFEAHFARMEQLAELHASPTVWKVLGHQ